MLSLRWDPRLLDRLVPDSVDLPEYPNPYRILRLSAGAPLQEILAEHPVVRIAVPADLRARSPIFAALRDGITRSVHSQPPHHDHPHRSGDPRRYNLFWAEQPRRQAATLFFPSDATPLIATTLTRALCGDQDAWQRSLPMLQLYARDPIRLSRYRLPPSVVAAYARLLRDGDPRPWSDLTPFGQTTVTTRIYSNHAGSTCLLELILAALRATCPGWIIYEPWEEPALILADDTSGTHARLGYGESGEHFYRIWVASPEGQPGPHDLPCLR